MCDKFTHTPHEIPPKWGHIGRLKLAFIQHASGDGMHMYS